VVKVVGLVLVASGVLQDKNKSEAKLPPEAGKSPQPVATNRAKDKDAPEEAHKADPQERFKSFVKKMEEELPKRYAGCQNIQYDIRKSDSVLSPLTGILTFQTTAGTVTHLLQYEYAFREDHWIHTNNKAEIMNPDSLPSELLGAAIATRNMFAEGKERGADILDTSKDF
jgi:hypothetical protein